MKENMAKYRTILVAICALMMIGVFAAPVLAQSSGSVANSAQSTNYPPVIVSVTPSTTQNVAPVPEGTAAPTVTLRATDQNGASDITGGTWQVTGADAATQAAMADNSISFGTPAAFFTSFAQVDTTTVDSTLTGQFSFTAPAALYTFNAVLTDAGAGGVDGGQQSNTVQFSVNYLAAAALYIETPTMSWTGLQYATQTADGPHTTLAIDDAGNTPIHVASTFGDWSNGAGSTMPASVLSPTVSIDLTPHVDGLPSEHASIPMYVTPPALGDFIMSGTYTSTTTLTAS